MSPTKALFTFSYGEENFQKLRKLGYDITYIPEGQLTEKDLEVPYEVMVCFNPFEKFPASRQLPSLRWIQLVSKGINHVPDYLVQNEQIQITNNADTTCIPIAELIVTYLLEIFKQSKDFFRKQNSRTWSSNKDILEVFGKTIGFLGTGNIATQAARRLKAFDAVIYGVNSNGHAADSAFDRVFSMQQLDKFWGQCDVIVSTLPATPQTFHLLSETSFCKMKPGVSIINISRGSVICEEDLIARLRQGFFRGVAMDVFEKEPLSADSPLWDFDNVIITPHNALYSDLYDERLFAMIYKNMEAYRQNRLLLNQADFTKGY